MKLVRFLRPGSDQAEVGMAAGNTIRPLAAMAPPGGCCDVRAAQAAMQARGAGQATGEEQLALRDVTVLAPVAPRSFRDFYAFEQHVVAARRNRGLEMVAEWYDAPAFYFSNPAGLIGPGESVVWPEETQALDFELELAAVIGVECRDLSASAADEVIAGFTVLNDWSARDIQKHEMKVGLGPAKGKDFCTSLGPWLVTPDELAPFTHRHATRGCTYSMRMTAAVNGKQISAGNSGEMRWTFAELIERASSCATLQVGDVIGSGTVGTGCITEFPTGTWPWLQQGDVVTLEVEGIGRLENRLARSPR
ncbi:MAG: fumarylacetoacetate hydrolase family protein [Armatimonadetes bacterium]|nr:fumarylacetoacetate hydrolase family protein [Armatimonadota bacterium]MDE2206407.1 fumarylacetoacetate hydrolase family protein [Armatimonadota bacterium]